MISVSKLFLLLAAGGCLLVSGCGDGPAVVRGSGSLIQERRNLRPVENVEVRGAFHLRIHVNEGGADAAPGFSSGRESILWIEAPEDLMGWVETEIYGDRLVLGTRDGVRLDPLPQLELTVSRLSSLVGRGRGEIVLENAGTGPMAERLTITTHGSVDVRARGAVQELVTLQQGSGDLRLGELRAIRLKHTSQGSGRAWVHVKEVAEVSLQGSCDLHLGGGATLERQDIRGSGRILRP